MKHRLFSAFLALCMVLTMFPSYAAAEPADALEGGNAQSEDRTIIASGACGAGMSSGGVTYTIYSDRTIVISGTGNMTNTSVPPWQTSGKRKEDLYYIQRVIVEEGVTSISPTAFRDCVYLNEVILPESVREIGSDAFRGCYSLSHVTIPSGVTVIGDGAFEETSIATIVIPAEVAQIGKDAFAFCPNLTTVADLTPDGLACLCKTDENDQSEHYIAGTPNIRDIYIPTSEESNDNPWLTDYKLGENGEKAEIHQTGLKSQGFNPIPWLLFNDGTLLVYGSETIPDFETVSDAPWKDYSAVHIGGEVTAIGACAFWSTRPVPILMSAGVKTIGDDAFLDVESLTFLGGPKQWAEVEIDLSHGNEELESAIPAYEPVTGSGDGWSLDENGVFTLSKTINNPYATNPYNGQIDYYGVRSFIRSARIAKDCATLGNGAFLGCLNLETLYLPSGVTSVTDYQEHMFQNCDKLKDIYYFGTEEQWANVSGRESGPVAAANIHFACDVSFDPNGGTGFMYSLTPEIGALCRLPQCDFAAPEGKRFKAWRIGEEEYRSGALHTFTADTTVTALWKSAEIIESGNCGDKGDNVTYAIYSDRTMVISGYGAMSGQDDIYSTPPWSHLGDSTNFSKLSYYIQRVIIEEGVTTLAPNAFADCYYLNEVIFPESLLTIGSHAFMECYGLTHVELPSGLTKIENGAFDKTSVSVFVNPPNAGRLASLHLCPNLTVVVTNQSAAHSFGSFSCQTYNVRDMYLLNHNKTADTTAENKGIRLHYTNLTEQGSEPIPWLMFTDGTLLAYGVGDMPDFDSPSDAPWHKYSSQITTVHIAGELTSVGANAFADCAGLTAVQMSAMVETVGENAFRNANVETVTYLGGPKQWAATDFASGNDTLAKAEPVCEPIQKTDAMQNSGTLDGWELDENGVFTLSKRIDAPSGNFGLIAYQSIHPFIRTVRISSEYPTLGESAFSNCVHLNTLYLPANITIPSLYQFTYCEAIRDIYFYGTPEQWKKLYGDKVEAFSNATVHFVCEVSFDANGGSGEMESVTAEIDGTFTLPECAFTAPSGQRFKAWLIGSTEYQPGEAYTLTANTTVKAAWENLPPVTYSVTYDKNGGTGTMANGTATEGQTFILPANRFAAPSGYRFKAWRIGETEYQPGDAYTFTADTAVKAVWEYGSAETYTITYDANGGSGTKPNGAATQGRAFILPKNDSFTPPSLNVRFEGWRIGDTVYPSGTEYLFTENATLKAAWADLTPGAVEVIESGDYSAFGGNVTYTIYSDRTMVISGEGYMAGQSDAYSTPPWEHIGKASLFNYVSHYIRKVTVEEGVKSLCNNAFADCWNLNEISLPESLVSIGAHAFMECYGLTHVEIPSGVTEIGDGAFEKTSVSTIVIPAGITRIGHDAFALCPNLTALVDRTPSGLACDLQTANDGTRTLNIRETPNIRDIYVPTGEESSANSYWQYYEAGENETIRRANLTEQGSDPIPWLMFDDGTLLAYGNGPMPDFDSASDAPWHKYSAQIAAIHVAGELTAIGANAFADCGNLKTVRMSAEIESVGENAFKNASVEAVTYSKRPKDLLDFR